MVSGFICLFICGLFEWFIYGLFANVGKLWNIQMNFYNTVYMVYTSFI